jgi:phage shock protein E
MTKKEFEKILEDGCQALLLDIREADELTTDESIPGATHMPMGKVFTEVAKGNISKEISIIVFCRSGMRAAIVVKALTEHGYDIEGLEGGLNAFRTA